MLSLFAAYVQFIILYRRPSDAKQSLERRRLQLGGWRRSKHHLISDCPPIGILLSTLSLSPKKFRMSFFKAKKGSVASKEEMRHRREVTFVGLTKKSNGNMIYILKGGLKAKDFFNPNVSVLKFPCSSYHDHKSNKCWKKNIS